MQRAEVQEYCDLCGRAGTVRFHGIRGKYDILVCQQCGLLWTNPLRYPSTDKPTGSAYWAEGTYLSNADAQKKRFRSQLDLVLKKANLPDTRSMRALEVGSGLGFFLDVCEECGIMAQGCDIAERAIAYCNRERERARLGTLDDHYENDSFDAIFAFNLIEHLTHPGRFLMKAKRVLKPKGVLVLETPIQESLFDWLSTIAYRASRGALNFLSIGPGGHIYKFSLKTSESICRHMGFRILYQKNTSSPFGEIWGKSSAVTFNLRFIYRLSLPIAWVIAKVARKGNRLLILLQKL